MREKKCWREEKMRREEVCEGCSVQRRSIQHIKIYIMRLQENITGKAIKFFSVCNQRVYLTV